MQFRQSDQDAIARGELTLTFRRWRRPQARAGGRYRVGSCVIEVTAVDSVDPAEISNEDARAAGHDSPKSVLEAIHRNQHKSADPNAPLYRVAFRSLGEQTDPRTVLAAAADLDSDELAAITDRLTQMDTRSPHGPWTQAALEAISAAPGRRAAELAAAQGRETPKYKADIRKLKALGLTISLEVGYELSPRGQSVLDVLQQPAEGQ
jgi:hypothetical protein